MAYIPEVHKEQLFAENSMHAAKCIATSTDPNLSKVDMRELGMMEIEAWTSLRELFSLLGKHATDNALTEETRREIIRKFSNLKEMVVHCPKDNESQKNFVGFMNNMLCYEEGINVMIDDELEGWRSCYMDYLRPMVEMFK